MQPNCCHVSFAFILKFFNFLQAFVGLSIIIYSIWMLDQWNHRVPLSPPSIPPPPPSSLRLLHRHHSPTEPSGVFYDVKHLGFSAASVSGLDARVTVLSANSIKLPASWFIYASLGVGVLLCCVTLIGCIATEAINGCCLCFYSLLTTVLILLEAALVAFIAIDDHWDKDIPFDPTGELESLRSFIEDNVDMCKWAGITVVIIQAVSVLLAIVLRAMVSTQRRDFDGEDGYENARDRPWEPLLNPQLGSGGSRVTLADIWSSRIREKYGLNSGDKNNSTNQNV